MRSLLVAGNWKMNASTQQAEALVSALCEADLAVDVAVFPPFPYLSLALAKSAQSTLRIGAQNVAEQDAGAFTGEVSASMLADVGCTMALVGHSERRTLYAETNEQVLAKTKQLLANGITAVVCVGETLAERRAGQEQTVVGEQLAMLLEQLSNYDWQQIVLAYEPVWAIGTGETATPEQAQAMHGYIRSLLQQKDEKVAATTRILYGGSVKASSAAELFAQPDIDGGLVGGASLDAAEFLAICKA